MLCPAISPLETRVLWQILNPRGNLRMNGNNPIPRVLVMMVVMVLDVRPAVMVFISEASHSVLFTLHIPAHVFQQIVDGLLQPPT